MDHPHFWLGAGWIGYCALHSILADPGIKSRAKQLMGRNFKLYRLFYSLTAILLLIPLIIYQSHMYSPRIFQTTVFISAIAAAVAITGLVGMFLSLKKYIASPAGFKDLFFEGVKPDLQVKGLHRHVRHPLYLSTFLLIWGVFFLFPLRSLAIVNIIITSYTLLAIRFEENKLVRLYGDSYRIYQKNVPMILPKIKP